MAKKLKSSRQPIVLDVVNDCDEQNSRTEGTGNWDHRWEDHKTNRILGVKLSKSEYGDLVVDFEPKPNTSYFLLYVQYSSGDSFGQSYGNIAYIQLYEKLSEAERDAKLIREHNDAPERSFKTWEDAHSLTLPGDHKFYCNWKGYFESVENICVQVVNLLDEAQTNSYQRYY